MTAQRSIVPRNRRPVRADYADKRNRVLRRPLRRAKKVTDTVCKGGRERHLSCLLSVAASIEKPLDGGRF